LVPKVILLVFATILIFGSTVAILLRIVPGPHRETDYLVIGAVGTLVSLLALFFVLISGWVKAPDVFFKRRKQ
jgi:hypothetical protein